MVFLLGILPQVYSIEYYYKNKKQKQTIKNKKTKIMGSTMLLTLGCLINVSSL